MAPKKKAAAKDGEVDTFEDFRKRFKKLLTDYGLPTAHAVDKVLKERDEVGDDIPNWVFTEEVDPMALRLMFQALVASTYNKFSSLRMWNVGGDEAVWSTCFYLDSPCQRDPDAGLSELQITSCGVTPLGCSFIGRTLGFECGSHIQCLKLDGNPFGAAGVEQLAQGLAQNSTIRRLDLNYCEIDAPGGRALFEILIFAKTGLEMLELRGNKLGAEGFLEVIRGAKHAKKLKSLDVQDNKIHISGEVLDEVLDLFKANTILEQYFFQGNNLTDEDGEQLVLALAVHCKHLKVVRLPEDIPSKTYDALEQALGGGKAKGKKKKKK